jgi:multicomponent Na+:H+ antiporter subunit F
MQELVQQNAWIFTVILIVLAIMLIAFLIRAIIGPRIADRLVAVNMITTMVMAIVSILAIVMDEGYLVDIAIIYAMLSFLAVVMLVKIYIGVYRAQKEGKEKSHD